MLKKATFIEITGIGKVQLAPSAKAKRMNLSVKGLDKVRIAMPSGYSQAQAVDFALKHRDWISGQLEKYRKLQQKTFQPEFETHFHRIKTIPQQRADFFIRVQNQVAEIFYPEQLATDSPGMQKAVAEALNIIYKREAIVYLSERIFSLSVDHHLPFNDLSIKNIRTRWGSCSATKKINLSYHLMKLPKHLIDFVILHELTHTLEMNHGPRFKAKLNEISGGKLSVYSKELKQYRI